MNAFVSLSTIRKGAIAAIAAVALTAAGAVTAPNEAQASGKVAAAVIGGLLIGGLIASHARPVYAAPRYGVTYQQPHYYGPRCHWERQRVWNPYRGHWSKHKVKVCY